MKALALAWVVLGGIALTVGVATAAATYPGRNGVIALSQFGDLYLLTPEGDRRQFTFGPAYDSAPTFSADGRRIIFVRDPTDGPRRLYTLRSDGTHVRRLPGSGPHDYAPAFSPSGRRIVFQSSRHVSPDGIWTIHADGTQPRQLTILPGWSGRPTYSPDGRSIVFSRGDDGVWRMDADGGHLRRLAKANTVGAPSFSPNGKRIAFEKNSSVYTMRADGSDKRRLTRGHFDEQPTYSPNGKRIAFFRYALDDVFGVRAVGTFIIDATGRNLHKIVDGKVGDRLDWQPLPREDPSAR